MRPLEGVLLAATAALGIAVWLLARPRTGLLPVLALVVVAAFVLQLAIEGYRTALLPLYACAVLAVAVAFMPPLRQLPAPGLLLVTLGAGLWAGVLHPVLALPQPSGPFAVQVRELMLDDRNIDLSTLTAEQAPPRVQLWQPAEPPGSSPAGRRPLLVYFPGWPGTAIENLGLVRELASAGFVVATVEYPKPLPGLSDRALRRMVRELEAFPAYRSEQSYRDAVTQSIARVRKRARDASRVVDALLSPPGADGSDAAAIAIDPARIGILGFSLGGAVAAEAAWLDPRFKAVLNLDGRHWAEAREHGVRQPYLFISEPLPLPTEAELNAADADHRYNAIEDLSDYTSGAENLRRNGGYHLTITGMWHMNFTDLAFRSRYERRGQLGPIDARLGQRIASEYARAFFRWQLMSERSPLFDGPAAVYPQAQLEVFPPPPSIQTGTDAAPTRGSAINAR